jgi:predicted nucleic acid-binding protein
VDAALAVVAEFIGPARSLTTKLHSHAVKLARADGLSFYDARVIAAAADANCHLKESVLGEVYRGVAQVSNSVSV